MYKQIPYPPPLPLARSGAATRSQPRSGKNTGHQDRSTHLAGLSSLSISSTVQPTRRCGITFFTRFRLRKMPSTFARLYRRRGVAVDPHPCFLGHDLHELLHQPHGLFPVHLFVPISPRDIRHFVDLCASHHDLLRVHRRVHHLLLRYLCRRRSKCIATR